VESNVPTESVVRVLVELNSYCKTGAGTLVIIQ